MTREDQLTAVCLAGVAVFLLLVGVVSATTIRHAIQIAPIVVVLAAVARDTSWGPSAAIPLFVIWLLLMILIWLYLLGFQTFFTGTFSVAEVILCVLIGVCSALGISAGVRSTRRPSVAARAVAMGSFAALQVGAMWVSFLAPFANR